MLKKKKEGVKIKLAIEKNEKKKKEMEREELVFGKMDRSIGEKCSPVGKTRGGRNGARIT